MALDNRFVNSRADFHRVLDEAIRETMRIAGPKPKSDAIENILNQLDMMQRWTAGGREPTRDERKSIYIGPIVAKELEPVPDDMNDYVQKLHELNFYFKLWPTDDQLADLDPDDWRTFFPLED